MQQYVHMIVEFVRANEGWAAPLAFLLAFGESLAFISLLLPSTAILIAMAGLLGASDGNMFTVGKLIPVWVAAGLGGTLGYALSYWIGLYFKDSINDVWPFKTRPQMLASGRAFFEKWGTLSVFLGHFFGPVRAVIPVVAGTLSMNHLAFQLANATSAFLWAAGVLFPAMFGARWLFG